MKPTRIIAMLASALCVFSASAEDAYLESTGGIQHLDTKYYIGPHTKLVLDYKLTSLAAADTTTPASRLLGFDSPAAQAQMLVNFGGVMDSGTAVIRYKFGDFTDPAAPNMEFKTGGQAVGIDTDRHTMILDCHNGIVKLLKGEVEEYSNTDYRPTFTKTATYPMGLFSRTTDTGGTVTDMNVTKMRVYGFKFYESDQLVHSFIPASKGGAAGFYDTVTGGFLLAEKRVFATADTTSPRDFTLGGDFYEVTDDGYVESTGSQAVNLKFCKTANMRMTLDFAFTEVGASAVVLGKGAYAQRLSIGANGALAWLVDHQGVAGGNTYGYVADTRRHTIDVWVNASTTVDYIITDGCYTNFTHNRTITPAVGSDIPFGAFGTINDNKGITSSAYSKAKIYGIKIYDSGVLKHDFVPCLKGGIAGLRDKVDGVFVTDDMTALNGPRLTCGGNIESDLDDPSLTSGNGQHILTGYCFTPTTRIEADVAYVAPKKDMYMTGNINGSLDKIWTAVYCNSLTNYAWSCQDGSQNSADTGLKANTARRTFILDSYNSKAAIITAGFTNYVATMTTARTKTGTGQLGIFCTASSQPGTYASWAAANMKLYGYRIYESDVLQHDYRPFYMKGCAVAGLRDEVTGKVLFPGVMTNPFVWSGTYNNDGAYLASSQQQMISTDYLMTPSSCVEVDFAMNVHTNSQERIFSCDQAGDLRIGLYCSGSTAGAGAFAYGIGDDTVGSGIYNYPTGVNVDLNRHKAVVDLAGGYVRFITGSTTNYSQAITTSCTKTATVPLAVFGSPLASGSQAYSNVRIYSVRITESGVLKHLFLPYDDGIQVGLKDIVTGAIKTDVLGSGVPLVVGGKGWCDEDAVFGLNPQDCSVGYNGTVTLSAFAPGAIGYQWLCVGEPILNATNMTYSVAWRSRVKTEDYSVIASFDPDLAVEPVESTTATVTFNSAGTAIFVR